MTESSISPEATDTTDWVRPLLTAASSGSVIDLSGGEGTAAAISPGGAQQAIPAKALRDALLATHGQKIDPRGLQIRGAKIHGRIELQHLKFDYPLRLVDCTLDDVLDMRRAHVKDLHLTGTRVKGVSLDRAMIDGDLFMNAGFRSDGVSLFGAKVSGDINLCDAVVGVRRGVSLRLDDAEVTGSVFAQRGFTALGTVQALSVRITGQLRIANSALYAPGGIALHFDSASFGGIDAENLKATGAVVGIGADIGAELSLNGAQIHNHHDIALALDGSHVKGSVHMGSGFVCKGQIRMSSVTFEHQLVLFGGTLVNPNSLALALQRAKIGQIIFTNPRSQGPRQTVIISGVVQMIGAEIGEILLSGVGALPTVDATGWSLTDVHGALRDDWRLADRWLSGAPKESFSVQPWHAISAVYARNGHPEFARHLNFAAAKRLTRQAPWPARFWRACYGVLVGYGYRWWRAGAWLLAVILTGVLAASFWGASVVPTDLQAASKEVTRFHQQRHQQGPNEPISSITPCEQLGNYPCASRAMYAITALAPAPVPASPGWTAVGGLAALLAILKACVWALAAVFLAGMAGILRKL